MTPSADEVRALNGRADPKDPPILTATVRERSDVRVTSDERDARRHHPDVEAVTPGVLVQRARRLVAQASAWGGT